MIDEKHKEESEDGVIALLHHRGALHYILKDIYNGDDFDSRELSKNPESFKPEFDLRKLSKELFIGKSYRQLRDVFLKAKEMPVELQRVFRHSHLDLVVGFSVASNINSLGWEPDIAMQFLISGLMFCCHFDHENTKWAGKEKHEQLLNKMIESIQQTRMERTAFEEIDDLLK